MLQGWDRTGAAVRSLRGEWKRRDADALESVGTFQDGRPGTLRRNERLISATPSLAKRVGPYPTRLLRLYPLPLSPP